MTPFALSGLLTLVTSIGVGVLMLVKTPAILTNRLWAYFNFSMAIWGIGAYEIGTIQDPKIALLWMRIAHIGVITIPVFFLHFVSSFFEKVNKKIIISTYLIAGFFLSILFTNLFIKDILYCFNSFYYRPTHPTSLYTLFFCFWFCSMIYSFYLAHTNIDNVSSAKRNQIKYFFLIITLGYTGGFFNFMPVFGIMIYPYGNFLVPLFIALTTYIILKYNLLDIRIVIRRSLIYSLLVTTITIIFLISVLISQYFFNKSFHNQNIIISLITAILIALIFTPLRNRIQDLVDRSFFKATPMEMAQQNEQLREEIAHTEQFKMVAALASSMAHEIKNPLTPIKTFTEQLPNRLNDKEFLLKFSTLINKEVDRIDSLVQELLLFAKPSPPQLKETNIHQLIEQSLELLKSQISNQQITLKTSFSDKNTLLHIDPRQIQQALLNILLNAIDSMPNGGELSVITASQHVIPAKAGIFTIEISDTGCGIAPEDLKHIFEPFYTKKEKGTGLGLAITQGIIEKHGGIIKVESKIGQGTTFKIILPQNYAS